MVLKSQPMSDEMAARVAKEQTFQVETEARKWEGAKELVLRQWCVDRAVQLCGSELGIMWYGQGKIDSLTQGPPMKCAVVPIAEDILRFITGGEKT